jgi:ribosomal-protein-alanine N-acetyltransferase
MDSRETERLTLRAYEVGDVDALYAIQGDREYMRFTHWSQSREACAAWLQQYVDAEPEVGYAPWTIVHRADRRIVGWGGLNIDPNAREWGPEVSYFIHADYQGIGLATELVLASVEFGFRDLQLPTIGAFARPENSGSARVLTKCGFEYIGYERTLQRNHYELTSARWRNRGGPAGGAGSGASS